MTELAPLVPVVGLDFDSDRPTIDCLDPLVASARLADRRTTKSKATRDQLMERELIDWSRT